VTRQGAGSLAVGVASFVLGVAADWPELVTIGLVLSAAVTLAALWALTARNASVGAVPEDLEVPRLSQAATKVTVRSRRRFGVVVEEENEATPRPFHSPSWDGHTGTADIEFDTSRRTVTSCGPLLAAWADPFGFVHRTLAQGPVVRLVVTPRLGDVDDDLRMWNPGDDWEAPRSHRKTHLSELLREYVIGDEPRRIHWRSTARTGTLIVRERVGTESRDTLVYLDTDPRAWQSGKTFDADDSLHNFELGVELATSVVHRLVVDGVQLAFLHGQVDHAFFVDRTSRSAFDRKMAEIVLQPTLGSAHQHLPGALRSHRFRRIIVVTFRPSAELGNALLTRGRDATIRLITPMPPASGEHPAIPVESVRWTPTSH